MFSRPCGISSIHRGILKAKWVVTFKKIVVHGRLMHERLSNVLREVFVKLTGKDFFYGGS
jgi:hypothetical protein